MSKAISDQAVLARFCGSVCFMIYTSELQPQRGPQISNLCCALSVANGPGPVAVLGWDSRERERFRLLRQVTWVH